ncbi:MAG: hypothetical protein HKN03_11475 [Acidimicrobiales bacterium]|nr:hypothetical protein [Acidimicrobiales bacterium]
MIPPAHYERRRPVPSDTAAWSEAHLTLAVTEAASILIWAAIHPEADHAEQVCVVWPFGGLPVVMVEADIPIPADRWEFRTSGLWAEQVCETPHQHWSYGLEAFALELDDSAELTRTGYGTRVPLGWELDFEADGRPAWLLTDSAPLEIAGAYTQPGSLHGLLLDAAGEHSTEGAAQRWHWWGTKPLSNAGIGHSNDQPEHLQLPLSAGLYTLTRCTASLHLALMPALG